jgi:hypothetical protein
MGLGIEPGFRHPLVRCDKCGFSFGKGAMWRHEKACQKSCGICGEKHYAKDRCYRCYKREKAREYTQKRRITCG